MIKRVITVFFAFFIFGLSLSYSRAASTPIPSPIAQVDSFEIFWPITPGKVEGDKLYGLKIFKENLRESLIFGKAQKSDYEVFLSVKRVVEAEQLLEDKKTQLAQKTLKAALVKLTQAESNAKGALEAKEDFSSIGSTMVTRLENISKLMSYLSSKYPDSKNDIDQVNETAKSLLKAIQ